MGWCGFGRAHANRPFIITHSSFVVAGIPTSSSSTGSSSSRSTAASSTAPSVASRSTMRFTAVGRRRDGSISRCCSFVHEIVLGNKCVCVCSCVTGGMYQPHQIQPTRTTTTTTDKKSGYSGAAKCKAVVHVLPTNRFSVFPRHAGIAYSNAAP